MKILHIAKFNILSHPGGIERFIKDLVLFQADKNLKIKVLCFNNKNKIEHFKNVEIFSVKIDFNVSYAPISIKYNKILNDILCEFNPDIIHIHMPNSMPLFFNFKNIKSKIVLQWQSDVFFTKNNYLLSFLYNFYKIFENRLLKKADIIIASSEEYFSYSKPLKRFKDKVVVIPLGIKSYKKNFDIEYGDFFLSIGRFTYYKGFKYLIDAMSYLDDKYKLIIAGDGEEFNNIKNYIKEKRVENRVKLTGRISEDYKTELLSKCRFFCLPSIERTEAFGISLLEAMQFKKPLITTKIPGSGVNFVNINNETGLTVPIKDSKSLANAIENLYNNLELCKKLGENAYIRFKNNFTIDKCGEKVINLYLKII